MLDLERYLDRIGLAGRPSLAELHRAHLTAIPFENLDPRRGVPASVAPDDLERKLVVERRGGYCFEQNLLFAAAVEALGMEVDRMLARVRVGAPAGTRRARSHLVLRVRTGGELWHADVGFGLGSPLEPLPFGAGSVHEQAGWRFRVVEDGPELVLQAAGDDGFEDLYGFVPEPVPPVDIEVSNWYTATHPRSPFVTGLIVCAQRADGARTMLSDRDGLALTEQTPADTVVTPVAWDDVPELLERRFGLRAPLE